MVEITSGMSPLRTGFYTQKVNTIVDTQRDYLQPISHGGTAGGGNAGTWAGQENGSNGTANTGGGASYTSKNGGMGGSGIVILKVNY